jgi:hypothetical protein
MIELYRKYREQGVFRKDQVTTDYADLDRNAINTMIERAKRETKVIRSIQGRRGIYFIVEPGQDYNKAIADPNKVAANIAPGAVICYSSAPSWLANVERLADRYIPLISNQYSASCD